MNNDQASKKADEIKGKMKEKVAEATANSNTHQQVLNDQVNGKFSTVLKTPLTVFCVSGVFLFLQTSAVRGVTATKY